MSASGNGVDNVDGHASHGTAVTGDDQQCTKDGSLLQLSAGAVVAVQELQSLALSSPKCERRGSATLGRRCTDIAPQLAIIVFFLWYIARNKRDRVD